MQLEFSYKCKWNCSSHGWVQKKKKKKPQKDLDFSVKKAWEILREKKRHWEKQLNIISSFCIKMLGLCVHILYSQDCANQFRNSHCQGEKNRTVCTRLWVSFSLDLQTRERKLRTLITVKDGHMTGYVIFPWYQLARGFTKLGSWERWDREGRRWMNCAYWPEGTVPAGLRELFSSQKSLWHE